MEQFEPFCYLHLFLESVCREARRLFLFLSEYEGDSHKTASQIGKILCEVFSKTGGNRGNKRQHFINILIFNGLRGSILLPLSPKGGNKGQQIRAFRPRGATNPPFAPICCPRQHRENPLYIACCPLLPLLPPFLYKRARTRIRTRTRGTRSRHFEQHDTNV